MFDIGFPELLIVSVVALLVIGPEKLPETVKSIAIWVGRFKRSLANIKTELENEIGADEIRRELRNDAIMRELNEAKENLNSIVEDANTTMTEIKDSARIDTSKLNPGISPDEAIDTMKPLSDSESDGETGSGNTQTDTSPTQDDRTKQSESGG